VQAGGAFALPDAAVSVKRAVAAGRLGKVQLGQIQISRDAAKPGIAARERGGKRMNSTFAREFA